MAMAKGYSRLLPGSTGQQTDHQTGGEGTGLPATAVNPHPFQRERPGRTLGQAGHEPGQYVNLPGTSAPYRPERGPDQRLAVAGGDGAVDVAVILVEQTSEDHLPLHCARRRPIDKLGLRDEALLFGVEEELLVDIDRRQDRMACRLVDAHRREGSEFLRERAVRRRSRESSSMRETEREGQRHVDLSAAPCGFLNCNQRRLLVMTSAQNSKFFVKIYHALFFPSLI